MTQQVEIQLKLPMGELDEQIVLMTQSLVTTLRVTHEDFKRLCLLLQQEDVQSSFPTLEMGELIVFELSEMENRITNTFDKLRTSTPILPE